MDKMKMQTKNLADENFVVLAKLFPNAVTETITGYDEDGKAIVERAIDADVLRQEISATVVEGKDERYQFTWPDKKKANALANEPISSTLRPCKSESIDFENTENLYIEGDNLEVLKLLQETYLEKVKMIYIDPPYNTGHDFVYEDDFSISNSIYRQNSGQYDVAGNRLVNNLDSNGRFHTDWLNMIYVRLRLARTLLVESGAIFISINDREMHNLRKICDEIFGAENCVGVFCWKTDGNFDNQAKVKVCHEYILLYAKNETEFLAPPVIDPNISADSKLFKSEIRNTIIKNGIKNPISKVIIPPGFPSDLKDGVITKNSINWPKYSEDIIIKDYKLKNQVIAETGWASKGQLLEFISNDFAEVSDSKGQKTRFTISKTGAIESIKKRNDVQSHVVSVIQNLGGTQKATADLGELGDYFDYPKPLELIKYIIKMNYYDDSNIVMDFFSGSGTTAEAVMQINSEKNSNLKYILVQLPENVSTNTKASNAGFKNICEIGKQRIRLAGDKVDNSTIDKGFRVLKLDSSNMKDIYYTPDAVQQISLDMFTDNIKEDRTPEDLLFQVMLDLGVLLSEKIEEVEIAGKKVFNVGNGFLLACFDNDISEDTVKEIAKLEPIYAVFRDSSMANDSVANNFDQIFESYSPTTVRKVL